MLMGWVVDRKPTCHPLVPRTGRRSQSTTFFATTNPATNKIRKIAKNR